MSCRIAKSNGPTSSRQRFMQRATGRQAPVINSDDRVRGNRDMAKTAKSRHIELELVDVGSGQTLKKGPNPGFLPSAGETVLLPLGPESWARYKVLTLESFMGYPDEAGEPEAQTSYFKIAIYAETRALIFNLR